MAKVCLSLDGKRVEVESGITVLEAARQNGVEIPTLCHDPRLKPTAACRLCLVDVAGARGPMPACTTQVSEGMVVKTATDDLTRMRRMALELLLSDHYGDCVAPCKRACPAGIDIQGYIALVANGQYREALKLIKESNPLPLVCGRVCPRFCEEECRRNIVDEPVAINALKRFVADYELTSGDSCIPEVKPPTGHKVAIVGGGPAGLSAAYYLALEGHEVTIFDSSPQLGGMLRYGIPEYRLPKAILDKAIGIITNLCHQVRCNAVLGRDFTVENLRSEGYEAILLALGAQANQKIRVEGEDLPGVLSGIGFLREVALGGEVNLGQKVAVIGGGNTAMDAARTALRLGADEVTIVYRRSKDEMPANDEEVKQAEEEGIKFLFLAAPVKLIAQNGRVNALECIRMALGEPDSSGRRRPEPIAGADFVTKVDTVIAAIGQTIDSSGLDGKFKLDRSGALIINEETMETSMEGVFSGGDCTSGPATVVEAIAAGRRAAMSINQYLSGRQITQPVKPYNCTKGELDEIDAKDYADIKRIPRTEIPALAPEARKRNFAEIEPGFTVDMVKAEAQRCLACGCHDVFECKLRELATEYKADDAKYAGRKRHLRIKENEHPYILRDQNKCILCGRCIRICNEVEGIGALGFAYRGSKTLVEPALGMPLSETACDSCGQCVSTCPTGALMTKVQLPKSGPWKLETMPTVCPYCGIGCNLELNVIGDKIVKVTSAINSPVNNGNLCKKGVFNPCSVNNPRRLKTPLISRGDNLVEATWEEAIAFAAEGLKQVRERCGGSSLAILSSPQLTNEENYLAQKLARVVLETNNIGCLTASVKNDSLMKSFGINASTCSYNDILNSDLILAFGCDIAEDYPIIAMKVREAVNKGSTLVMLSPRATRIDSLAKLVLKVNQRTSVELLEAMLNYIISYSLVDRAFVSSRTSGFEKLSKDIRGRSPEELSEALWVKPSKIIEAIHLYVRARKPVIIVNADAATSAELGLVNDLALVTGNVGREGAGIIALHSAGNAQGLIDMGVDTDYLPGHKPIADASARKNFEAAWGQPLPPEEGRDTVGIIQGIENGDIQGILILDSNIAEETKKTVFEAPIFSVLLSTEYPGKPPYASVILPAAAFAESDGTYTNCERRIQNLERAISPPAGKQNWEILSALADALGYPTNYASASGIYKEIARLVSLYKGTKIGNQWPFLRKGKFGFKDGLARFRLPESSRYEIALIS